MDHGKGVSLSHGSTLRMEKQLSAAHRSVVSPRAVGQKKYWFEMAASPLIILLSGLNN